MGVFVFRGQIDGPPGLVERFFRRIGPEQRLGADGSNHRPVRQAGRKLVADGQGADVIAVGKRGECRLDQSVNFRFFHELACAVSRIVAEHAIVA